MRCEECGEDRVVAFSCRRPAFCPSCRGRRIADTAARLTDEVPAPSAGAASRRERRFRGRGRNHRKCACWTPHVDRIRFPLATVTMLSPSYLMTQSILDFGPNRSAFFAAPAAWISMSVDDLSPDEWPSPVTTSSLQDDLVDLGVTAGMVLIVHCSLRSIGTVWGGAPAVILALENVLGDGGTLVMPTQTCHLLDPKGGRFKDPPQAWLDKWQGIMNDSYPAFDPALTPTDFMGWVAETFRKQNGVVRSVHPYTSFAAWGKHADAITADHPLDFPLGENSPLARIYGLHGYILLLGVDHDKSTSLHLAEHRATYASKRVVSDTRGMPMLVNGTRQWVRCQDINSDDYSDFQLVGEAFEADTDLTKRGTIGDSPSRLMPQAPFIDYASEWFEQNRD